MADVYDEALAQYDVKPYPGRITLFATERNLAGFEDGLSGWGEVARDGVQLFSLPIGPKASLVEAFVQQLAAILRDCLNQAMQASPRAKGDSETDVDPKQSVLTL